MCSSWGTSVTEKRDFRREKEDRKEEGGREGERLEESSGDSIKLKSPAKKVGKDGSTERRELTKRD